MSLRAFVFSILILLLLFSLLALLLPSKVTVTKSVLINAPKEAVRSEIVDFNNWIHWYPQLQGDNVYIKIDSPKNDVYQSLTLKNKKEKVFTYHFTKIKNDSIWISASSSSSVKVNFQFILTPHSNNATQLSWNVNSQMKWYPWEKIKGIFLDKVLGSQFEYSLQQIKKYVENKKQ